MRSMNKPAVAATILAFGLVPARARAQDAITRPPPPPTFPAAPPTDAPPPPPIAPTAATPAQGPEHPFEATAPTAATRPLEATTPLNPPAPAPSPVYAGFHNDQFYLSDRTGDFFLIPAGRLQLDPIVYVGDRVTDSNTTPTAFTRPGVTDGLIIRRARLELQGGIAGRITFMVGSDFALGQTPIGTDLYIDGRVHPLLHFQLGQFDAPFTMENRTSDKYLDFMERSLIVRGLAIPSNKELGLMVWGEDERRLIYYSLGVFNGDGQNRINRDDSLDFMARVFAHPLILTHLPIQNLQIGGSVRVGSRDRSVDYAFPAINTPGNVALFNPVLVSGMNPVVVVPDALQFALAGEIDLPLGRFDLRGECVYVDYGTREMAPNTLMGAMPINATAPATDARLAGTGVRSGAIHALGYYAQFGWWVFGSVGVNGRPGYENPASVRLGQRDAPVAQGLQVLARIDALDMDYAGGSRAMGASPAAGAPNADGWYNALGLELGANYWLTRHVRFTANYLEWLFVDPPASTTSIAPSDNHFHGPGPAHPASYGELMFRVAIAL